MQEGSRLEMEKLLVTHRFKCEPHKVEKRIITTGIFELGQHFSNNYRTFEGEGTNLESVILSKGTSL